MIVYRFARHAAIILSTLAAWPLLGCYRIGLVSFFTAAQMVALVPGRLGIHIRRFWYRRTLESCGADLTVEWMSVLKTPIIRMGDRVFIAPFCFIAECDVRDDVGIGQYSIVQGGPHTHGFERMDVPMIQQPGNIRRVTLGPDAWIGIGSRILTDVLPGTVVGAGAVVTRTFEPNAILVGVPARQIRLRGPRA